MVPVPFFFVEHEHFRIFFPFSFSYWQSQNHKQRAFYKWSLFMFVGGEHFKNETLSFKAPYMAALPI